MRTERTQSWRKQNRDRPGRQDSGENSRPVSREPRHEKNRRHEYDEWRQWTNQNFQQIPNQCSQDDREHTQCVTPRPGAKPVRKSPNSSGQIGKTHCQPSILFSRGPTVAPMPWNHWRGATAAAASFPQRSATALHPHGTEGAHEFDCPSIGETIPLRL